MLDRQGDYGGDEGLERLLAEAGCGLTAAAARAVIAGVLAAPPGPGTDGWTALIAPAAGPALQAELEALAEEMGAGRGDESGPGPAPPDRLEALRAELDRLGVDGFLVPMADEHQGEFLAACARRLTWLTGFSGSAGIAVVLAERAAIFVDGRYTLQLRDQVDDSLFTPRHLTLDPPAEWLADALGRGARLGYDPWLHTVDGLTPFTAACERIGAELVALEANPVDAVWQDQPPPPLAPVVVHEMRYAGRESVGKRRAIASQLDKDDLDAAVLTAPDSIAWLLNIRGGDIPHTPVALAFAIIGRDRAVHLFIDSRKLTADVRSHLGDGVTIAAPQSFGDALDALGAAGRRVQVASAAAPAWVTARLQAAGATVVQKRDPCVLPKSCKNAIELDGMRAAHLRDGAALTRFLAWLAAAAAGGGLDELAAARKLDALRAEGELFRGLSFDTISAAGPHGAIVHYRVDGRSSRRIGPDTVYLVDSGAQYLDGTTDVTRTVAIGDAGAEARDRFTRVLKGHIAIATARFPDGVTGAQLDSLARTALWRAGLDFDHGTGHGVGSYLGVHEGPQRIAKRGGEVALRPGMVVSNEPGYYKEDAYGIRIENLVVVVQRAAPVAGTEQESLEFETLTLAPIDRNMIEASLLTADEIAWLDSYHAKVRKKLTPLLDPETAAWLEHATRAVKARA